MVLPIDGHYGLARYFVEFSLLPELLKEATGEQQPTINTWSVRLKETGYNRDHVEGQDIPPDVALAEVMAVDVWRLATALVLLTPTGLSDVGREIAALSPGTVTQDEQHLMDLLAQQIQRHYLGQNDIPVIHRLQAAARTLATTDHTWASCCPGLLVVELDALILWSFTDATQADHLIDEMVTWRDVAMHRSDAPAQDVAPVHNMILHADAVTEFYLEQRFPSIDSPMSITELNSTAMLLTYCGLLIDPEPLSPITYLVPPDVG